MNKSIAARLGMSLGIAYFISFALSIAAALQQFSAAGVHQKFFLSWVALKGFVLWFGFFPLLTASALMLAFSAFIPRASQPRIPAAVVRLMQSLVVMVLLLTCAFSVVQYAVYPQAVRTMEGYARKTRQAEALLLTADRHEQDGEKLLAVIALQEYLGIWGEDDEAVRTMIRLQRELVLSEEDQNTMAGFIPAVGLREQQAGDLFIQARRLYEEEDWYGALFYGRLAYRLDSSRDDIALFINQARQKIGAAERLATENLSEEEQDIQAVFRYKQQAIDALLRSEPITAYYILLRLQQNNAADPDVRRYLPIAINGDQELDVPGVVDITYFIPEAQEMMRQPGNDELRFVHYWAPERKELVSIGKMVKGHGTVFFRNIEVVYIDESGTVTKQLSSPYGKLVSGEGAPIVISLHGIHPTQKDTQLKPEYYVGRPDEGVGHLLQLNIGLSELDTMDIAYKSNMGSPLNLYQAVKVLPAYGYDSVVPQVNFLLALLMPFVFFLVCFFSIGVAVRLYSRYERGVPFYLYPLIVLVPMGLYFLIEGYKYIAQILLSTTVSTWGLPAGVGVLIGSQVILFGIVLFFAVREFIVRD